MTVSIKKALSVFLCLAMMFSIFAAMSVSVGAEVIPSNYANKAYEYLKYIDANLSDRDCIGGEQYKDAQDWIISELKTAGYADDSISKQDFTFTRRGQTVTATNIVLVKEGASDEQIIIGAHYDGTGTGDNGSGTSLLLATATNIAKLNTEKTIIFIFFSAEEYGCHGSSAYANAMSEEEIAKTEYMLNMDSIIAGDYCYIYGGVADKTTKTVSQTEAYEKAMEIVDKLDLDIRSNPWTWDNPEPGSTTPYYPSPTTGEWSDHKGFKLVGIPYIYFEATNWEIGDYDGYDETASHGPIMNTSRDTLANIEEWFPGRAYEHFEIFSTLLNELLPIAKVTVSSPESAVAGEKFNITVDTQNDIIGFFLKNENGNNITIKSKSSVDNGDGTLTWTITTSVATSGSRTFELIPVSVGKGICSSEFIDIDITDAYEPVSIVNASFDVKAANVNAPVSLKITTGSAVSKIAIHNENGNNMGKTLASKVRNADGTITWNYTIKVGTIGERTFSIIANDSVSSEVSLIIV